MRITCFDDISFGKDKRMKKVNYSLIQEIPDSYAVKMEYDGWVKCIAVTGKPQVLLRLMEQCTRCALDPVHLPDVLEDCVACLRL